jgi:sulfur carrier protein ThiS
MYTPEQPPRYVFKGTYDEAIDFFNAAEHVETADADINIYTDGSTIIPPTEAKVAKMLTGTSLKPDTVVTDAKGNPVRFARYETATVEKVAIIGVMAGCKPEYMPILLAIAEQGGGSTNCPGTSSSVGTVYIVDGPIAKEMGLSAKHEWLDFNNRANVSLAKAARLMTINFGGCVAGISRTDAGNPLSVLVAEDRDGLPPGWETVSEDFGYKKNDSILVKLGPRGFGVNEFAPGASRRLQDGIGSIADDLGVLGKPGPHNVLQWLVPRIAPLYINSGHTFFIVPNLAAPIGKIYPTKQAVYEWLFNTFRATVRDYQHHGWWEFQTEIGDRVEGTNKEGLTFNQLYKKYGDDYKIPIFGARSPKENLIVVGGGGADESIWHFSGGRGSAVSIDRYR